MNYKKVAVFFGLMVGLFLLNSCNQSNSTAPTKAAWQRAEQFLPDSIRAKAYRLNVQPHWFADSSGFGYHAHTRNGKKYYKVLFGKLKKEPAFNTDQMADALEKVTGEQVSAENLPIKNIRWINEDKLFFSFHGKRYKADLKDYHIKQKPAAHKWFTEAGIIAPDGNKAVFIKDDNLYVRKKGHQNGMRLSTGGSKYDIYGSYYGWGELMRGEDAGPEPLITGKLSPDSKMFLTQIMDARKGKRMYLLNYVVDSLYRPVLLSYFRDSPADTNDVMYQPVIFDVDTHKMIKIDLPAYHHYMTVKLHWTTDSKHIYGLYYHRGYKKMDVIEANPQTGAVKTIWTDSSKTYVEPKTQFRYLEHEGIAFITSEKSGWNQLYRLNWNTGTIHPVTQGKYVVKKIVSVDTTNSEIYFTATGKRNGVNPYFNSLYKIGFDGSHLKLLTPEPTDHEVFLSPGEQYFVDNSSTARKPTVSLLRKIEDGKIAMKIDSADVDDLRKMGWRPPKVFTVTAHDSKTTIYGTLWKPTNFNPHHSYPVIDFTYTGPQMYLFNNTFTKTVLHSYDQYSPYYPSAQALAELGFIVIEVDGLGSAGRSKAFHDWSYEDLGNNLKDHVLAIKQLGRKYRWIDTMRVGIYGHSAGGYDAVHALEAFNKMFKVAVSESADHDWRMEKASWPELYVGWPVGENYQEQNNIAMAPQLKGKLLLIHGALDQNVNPSATFRLSEALIKAGNYFDELIIPSAHHHYLKYHAYVTKKRWHFFVEHLIINPPE